MTDVLERPVHVTGHYAEDLVPNVGGKLVQLTRTFHTDARDVHIFANVTGDRNPIHIDPAAGTASRFGTCIAHGMLTGSNIMTIVGMQLAPGVILKHESMRFLAPVPVGSRLVATVEAQGVHLEPPDKKRTHSLVDFVGWACIEGSEKRVVEMQIAALVPNRPK